MRLIDQDPNLSSATSSLIIEFDIAPEQSMIYRAKKRRCAVNTLKQHFFITVMGLLLASVATAQDKASQTTS